MVFGMLIMMLDIMLVQVVMATKGQDVGLCA